MVALALFSDVFFSKKDPHLNLQRRVVKYLRISNKFQSTHRDILVSSFIEFLVVAL